MDLRWWLKTAGLDRVTSLLYQHQQGEHAKGNFEGFWFTGSLENDLRPSKERKATASPCSPPWHKAWSSEDRKRKEERGEEGRNEKRRVGEGRRGERGGKPKRKQKASPH